MLTSATEEDFTAFQTTYGYTVASDAAPLLALSFAFLGTLPWCDDNQVDHASINAAQCFIAYAMSTEGGSFNPSARVDGVILTKKKIETLEKEFKVNDALPKGVDSISLLKSLPIAYGMLAPFLCESPVASAGTHVASGFVV